MGAPTTEFRKIPTDGTIAATAIDSVSERNAAGTGGLSTLTVVDTSGSNPLDFGSVSISAGANQSSVQAALFRVVAFNGSNTQVSNLRFWVTHGFDDVATKVKWYAADLDGGGTEWAPSPTISTFTYADLPVTDTALTQNVLAADGVTAVLTDNLVGNNYSDWTQALVMYIHVGASETLGTYQGTTASNELQFNLKFDYS